jgi:penicillin-binding protein 1A
MSLKLTCPKCRQPRELTEPLPMPGSQLHCEHCGQKMSMSYPPGLIDKLRSKGTTFEGDSPSQKIKKNPSSKSQKKKPTNSQKKRVKPTDKSRKSQRAQNEAPREQIKNENEKRRKVPVNSGKKRKSKFLWLKITLATLLLGTIGSASAGYAAYNHFSGLVPSVEELRDYRPPTVTTLYDRNGNLLGEIYEKRRYVKAYSDFPKHLVDSFLAAEDANYWQHKGIDYMGIVRAVLRNAIKGKKAQGASTITQQVARNFLLTSEKTYTRKIKEAILAKRIEETFSKEHILYLYLNQIYLGSGAYGVEAAARVYFNKHVEDLTLAESAIIAGLPQRPSDYSPHKNWKKARMRQMYVLKQLLEKEFIDQEKYNAAFIEIVKVFKQGNEFLKQAPHYTEHVRRHLVETYGFDKIYNDGLEVITACDLELQKTAQDAVYEKVAKASRSQGWVGPIRNIPEGEFQTFLNLQEEKLREQSTPTDIIITDSDSPDFGASPTPERSILKEKNIYKGLVLEVEKKHAIIGIGAHKTIVPLSLSKWGYDVDVKRSFKRRAISSLKEMLNVGDVVEVRVEALIAGNIKGLKGYKPIEGKNYAAVQIWKQPEIEGALFSYRVTNSSPENFDQGAVLAMVGGYDFEKSEYNRAIQAQRQIGSTFKPIVYAAAIASRQFTVATQILDAPTIFGRGHHLWRPGNYGNDYLGEISLRKALMKSRNVCTLRVLEKVSLEGIFNIAGPSMRIGYDNPVRTRTHISAFEKCEGVTKSSPVEGMLWCETMDPSSCPLVRADQQFLTVGGELVPVDTPKECLDTPVEKDGIKWCHSCDVNLRVCDWRHVSKIPRTDPCVDARMSPKGQMCRVCDMSMGLGSSSLTMVELVRAYSVFASYGKLIEPYFIESVKDRDGTIIEKHEAQEPKTVMDPTVAGISNWLLRQVATGGTAAKTNRLNLHVAGKTGTTNDYLDAWFVGYNPDILAATWVGYDTPKTMGRSFTGGDIALPIWMEFMKVAVPETKDRNFPGIPGATWVTVNESTGLLASDGRKMPMIPGTEPKNIIGSSEQKTVEDLLSDDF